MLFKKRFERQSYRGTEISSICLLNPHWLKLVQVEARNPELFVDLSSEWRGSNTLGLFCCFSRCINMELDWKCGSQPAPT